MTQMTLTLTVPDDLAVELREASQDFVAELLSRGLHERRIDRVLANYAGHKISFGAAAQELDMAQDELARIAYARGISPQWSEDTFLEEVGLV